MKKKVLFYIAIHFTLTTLVTTLHAQDTVQYGDSCYLFTPLASELPPIYAPGDTIPLACYANEYNTYELKITENDIRINVYGVAATVLLNEIEPVPDRYSAYLYEKINDDIVLIDSSTAYSCINHFHYHAHAEGVNYDSIVPCVEFYFNEPHSISGNIYVGIRRKELPEPGDLGIYSLYRAFSGPDNKEYWYLPSYQRTICHGWWGALFPIVQPERITCRAEASWVAERGDDYAVLQWPLGDGSYQLSLAPYNVMPDSGLVLSLADTAYTALGLDSGVYYAARLRTECHHSCPIHEDTTVWSPWGPPTLFYLGTTEPDTSSLAIGRPADHPACSLSPNPATGSVTVAASAPILLVELVAATGEVLLRRPMAGVTHCSLDLEGLPDGIYLVRLTTTQGPTTRRLVVKQ